MFDWQTPAAIAIVVLAIAYVIRRAKLSLCASGPCHTCPGGSQTGLQVKQLVSMELTSNTSGGAANE